MNFKTTYILFGALALILLGLTVALFVGPTPGDDNKFIFPSVNDPKAKSSPDEVDGIEIVRTKPAEKLVFVRDSSTKRWTVNGLRANADAVKNLITHIYEAQKTEAESPKSLADWGLEKPETVVTLKRADKPDLTLSVGRESPGDDASAVIYVLSSDRPKDPLAVRKSQLDIVLKDLASFREHELIAASSTDLKEVELAVGTTFDAPAIGLEMTSSGGWRYTAPERFKGSAAETEGVPTTEENKAPTNVRALLADLVNIKVEGDKGADFVADKVPEKDLKDYHLGAQDEKLFIGFKRADDSGKSALQMLIVGIGAKAKNKGDDKTEKFYALLKGENSVVRIPAKSVAALQELVKHPDALRDKHLVRTEGFKQPDAVVIRKPADKTTIEFFKPSTPGLPAGHGPIPSSWTMYRGDEAVPVQENLVNNLVSLLTGTNVEGFPDKSAKEADLGVADEDKAAAVVEVWIDGLAPEEKKAGDKKDEKKAKPKLKDPKKPTVKLIFGHKGPNKTVAVKRIAEGEAPALLWVKEAVFDQVAARPLDYMSRELPSFADRSGFDSTFKDVKRLELMHDGKDFVVVREGDKPWTIEKPEELKGRKADEGAIFKALGTLANLQATALVEEKATPDALEAIYGLGKSAALKASVTVVKKVKDKDETKTYDFVFGKNKGETEEYAKQSQRDMIFTVNKTSLAPLQSDLLDSTIFTFDPSKVKAVKLTGWKSVTGVPTTVELEQMAGQWKVKTPAGPMANAVNVNGLLGALSNLRADKFVAHNVKVVDAAYGLDPKKDALVITLTVEGLKEPLELTVGKLDGDKGYFAISPQAKGDVFYVKKAEFEGPKSKPGYFFQ